MEKTLILFIAGLIWASVKIVVHIKNSRKHLSEEDLFKVMRNKLNKYGEEYSRIIAHLGSCEKCQKALEEYSKSDKAG